MNTFGISDIRLKQIKNSFKNIDDDEIEEIVAEWGKENIERGYGISDFDGTGLFEIETIGDVGAFESDEEAAEQAVKDGVKIIPIEELPEKFNRRYLGWIDTAENRKAIERYTELYCMQSVK